MLCWGVIAQPVQTQAQTYDHDVRLRINGEFPSAKRHRVVLFVYQRNLQDELEQIGRCEARDCRFGLLRRGSIHGFRSLQLEVADGADVTAPIYVAGLALTDDGAVASIIPLEQVSAGLPVSRGRARVNVKWVASDTVGLANFRLFGNLSDRALLAPADLRFRISVVREIVRSGMVVNPILRDRFFGVLNDFPGTMEDFQDTRDVAAVLTLVQDIKGYQGRYHDDYLERYLQIMSQVAQSELAAERLVIGGSEKTLLNHALGELSKMTLTHGHSHIGVYSNIIGGLGNADTDPEKLRACVSLSRAVLRALNRSEAVLPAFHDQRTLIRYTSDCLTNYYNHDVPETPDEGPLAYAICQMSDRAGLSMQFRNELERFFDRGESAWTDASTRNKIDANREGHVYQAYVTKYASC